MAIDTHRLHKFKEATVLGLRGETMNPAVNACGLNPACRKTLTADMRRS